MNIIIPLGGIGSRFIEAGYSLPKPLINLLLKPMLFWLLDSLSFKQSDLVILVCNKRLENYRFKDLILKKYKNIHVLYLDRDTRGAAESVLEGLSLANLSNPTLLLDGDTFYNIDILNLYRKSKNKNMIFSFEQHDNRPIYSYVELKKGLVSKISEKIKISNIANTGAYGFQTGEDLKKYCEKSIKKFDRSKQKELYTSSVISDMIMDQHKFCCSIIKDSDFEVVGTPLQYKLFHNKYKTNPDHFKDFRICFDLDNTLVTHPSISGDYESVKPINENIDYAKFLSDLGCTIIIYTARRMKTHNGNVGKILADVGQITLNTIKKYDIPCDELYFGKPYADAYIDDLAYNAFTNFPFSLGLTNHQIKERDFNSVSSKTIQIFEKKSINNKKLKAEVFWYNNIPKEFQIFTPSIISYIDEDNKYSMEKIHGITFSELLVSESLTISAFDQFLNLISELHKVKPSKIDINLYSLYSNKLKKRYDSYDYSKFPNVKKTYNTIQNNLQQYEKESLAIAGCIHGDPVFSNIMAQGDNSIKLVDPRGLTGDDEFSIFGDVMYDYAKILQSLCGYDEILLTGKRFLDNEKFKNNLHNHIEKLYGSKYHNYIENIKNSLLFSLIPLHNDQNCVSFYELISASEQITN